MDTQVQKTHIRHR